MIAFTVYGKPQPQGSTRAFIPKGWSRPIITSDNKKMRPWREQIAAEAILANASMVHGPVAITMHFYFRRPKGDPHRQSHTVKPDLDKLCRSCLDSLTGVVLNDDAQVVKIIAEKEYTYGNERAWICIEEAAAKAATA